MNEKAAEEPKAVCLVEGCENEASGQVPVWQRPPIALSGNEPPVMVDIPLCTKHFAEYEALGAEEFFKKNPLKGAL
jgi:hypothetical protein